MTEQLQALLGLGAPDQLGFVVRDLDAAIAAYAPMFGEFTVMDTGEMEWDYRGRPEMSALRIGFCPTDTVEIELIQWVSGETPHKEFIDAGREGMHHVRFIVEDMDASIERAASIGFEPVWYKRFDSTMAACYLERTGDSLLIEFFQRPQA
jgi:catechol 2,3-dioxygenase-like lactoylglutathione lyase family enzyme